MRNAKNTHLVPAWLDECERWLERLHACPVCIGKPRSLLESREMLSVVRRLAKVMTRHPAYLERAVAMVRQMEELAEDIVDRLLVQTHGQYRPIHVFISDSSVAVIDLDQAGLAIRPATWPSSCIA